MYLHKDRVRVGQDLGLIYLATELKLLSCHSVDSNKDGVMMYLHKDRVRVDQDLGLISLNRAETTVLS